MKTAIFVLILSTFTIIAYGQNNHGNWVIKNELDDFGDKTDDIYLTTLNPIIGTYNDVYNTEAQLNIVIKIKKIIYDGRIYNYIYIIPYLGRNKKLGIISASKREYSILIKANDGNVYSWSEYYYEKDNAFRIMDAKDMFLDILKRGGNIKFMIKTHENEKNKESYLFEINNANNFNSIYNELMKL